ncbi:MAG: hypothetical protein GEV12_21935 [Micromonosporaceae bacterium]|nr:hypothetical protein [Micromonosporaceae bacterium]
MRYPRTRACTIVVALAGLVMAGLVASPAAAASAQPPGLQPGEQITLTQEIPVNVVFIGGTPVDHTEVAADLPATFRPVLPTHELLGFDYRPPGLDYQLDYRLIDASAPLAERYFRFLGRIGEPGGRTVAQQAYQDQQRNRLDLPEQVLHIDARRADRWLATQGRAALGLARDSYTLFFVDWYGRPDFQFHVYTIHDDDPDSGQPFEVRDVNAWGGADRTWFYDQSAGPVEVGGGWNVDDEDLDGNGVPDYRMPPSWEYHPDGFRDPAALGGDLGLIVRYVGVNQLFTPSMSFDPMVTAPGPGGAKVISLHVFQDLPGGDAIDRVAPDAIVAAFAALQPYHDWRIQVAGSDPIDAGARRSLEIILEDAREPGPPDDPGCWEPIGVPQAQLFCFFEEHHDRYFAPAGPADHLAPAAIFEPREELLEFLGDRRLFGFVERDWHDPTASQSFALAVSTPHGQQTVGIAGHTGLTAHELGHYFGLFHPYDGWDPVDKRLYGPGDDLLFTALAVQVHSLMATARRGVAGLQAPLEFSQFERDSLARWETAGYLNRANELAGQVRDHPEADRVRHLITAADQAARQARRHFDAWRFDLAAARAIGAYEWVAAAAQRLGFACDQPCRP